MKELKLRPKRKKLGLGTKIILFLPALLSAGWMAYIEFMKKRPIINEAGMLLSPPVESGVVIGALSFFTAGYVIFILLMFSEDIKEFFIKHSHKEVK